LYVFAIFCLFSGGIKYAPLMKEKVKKGRSFLGASGNNGPETNVGLGHGAWRNAFNFSRVAGKI